MSRYWRLILFVMAVPLLLAAAVAAVGLYLARPEPVGTTLVYEFVTPVEDAEIEQTAAAINRRFAHPPWQKPLAQARLDGRRVAVDVYGNDPARLARVKRLAGALGTLELRILANPTDHARAIQLAGEQDGAGDVRDGEDVLARWVPMRDDDELEQDFLNDERAAVRARGSGRVEVLVMIDRFNISGAMLADVRPGIDANRRSCLDFTMSNQGAILLSGLTSMNAPDPSTGHTRRLAIILNGDVMSAPTIGAVIFHNGQITGDFTREQVEDLVGILNAGSLPAEIRLVEQRTP